MKLKNMDSAPIPLAHGAAALDADPGYDEALYVARTVDPTGPACGSGRSLNNIGLTGIETGNDNLGNPESAIVSMNFGNGTFSGDESKATQTGFSTSSISGTYTIDSDCSVTLTRTVDDGVTKVTTAGAHVLIGGDPLAPFGPAFVWQGDANTKMWIRAAGDSEVHEA
ncbi:hypothetical protein WM23_33050 [Burkholderia ubonensis]|nr:hypothetical protein WM23_33050 [Burkholderia ubonensis]